MTYSLPTETLISIADTFGAADKAWGDELTRLFGNRAGDIRYTRQGLGKAGSKLRRLHAARHVAMMAWEQSRGLVK